MKVDESIFQVGSIWKASDNLKAAKALISDQNNWIKQFYEQDETGKVAMHNPLPACKFCTVGAYNRASLTHFGSRMNDYSWMVKPEHRLDHDNLMTESATHLRKALSELPNPARKYSGVADYNDDPTTTHEDILNLYDNAIAIAEKAESNA